MEALLEGGEGEWLFSPGTSDCPYLAESSLNWGAIQSFWGRKQSLSTVLCLQSKAGSHSSRGSALEVGEGEWLSSPGTSDCPYLAEHSLNGGAIQPFCGESKV